MYFSTDFDSFKPGDMYINGKVCLKLERRGQWIEQGQAGFKPRPPHGAHNLDC